MWKIPASGEVPSQAFISNSSGANGLSVDVDDRLIAAQHGKVSRYNADWSKEILAQFSGALQLGNVNDLALATDGCMYFTNWDGENVFYRSVDGDVREVASGFGHSNGVYLIEEDSILFVNDDAAASIYLL